MMAKIKKTINKIAKKARSVRFLNQNNSDVDISKTLHTNLNFAGAEAYKLLRVNLSFVLPSDENKNCRIIGVTSSVRGEGKSTTSINLAYSIAESGRKVLLIDGDMRLPSIGKKMNISNSPGLSNALVNEENGQVWITQSNVHEKWHILPAGDIPPNPSELLGSGRMKRLLDALVDRYDYIIFDLPPVNLVSDALAVSPCLDGMVVVAKENYVDRMDLQDCVRQLQIVNTKILGLVLTCVGGDGKVYYKKGYGKNKYYKHYYRYGYGKDGEDKNTKA